MNNRTYFIKRIADIRKSAQQWRKDAAAMCSVSADMAKRCVDEATKAHDHAMMIIKTLRVM